MLGTQLAYDLDHGPGNADDGGSSATHGGVDSGVAVAYGAAAGDTALNFVPSLSGRRRCQHHLLCGGMASPEDLDRQIRSSHYTRLLAIVEQAAEPPELRLNWVTDVKRLEYLESVRLCKESKP